jgi:hypothetical protein
MSRMTRVLERETRAGHTLPVAGIEREWTVRDSRDVLDYRTVIEGLQLGGQRLDPDDPHAHRCSWGGVVTADGKEAEVATPPLAIQPGVTAGLEALSRNGFHHLTAASPTTWTFTGYSTHLNVQIPDKQVVRVARRFTERFAVAQMLLLDRTGSPGLLVRPRRSRLEIGGEYASGDQLRAALAFAIATSSAATRRSRIPVPQITIASSTGRFGWYVDRRAAGPDLYREGRSALLQSDQGALSAQSYLEAAWESVRAGAVGLLSTEEVALVDDEVSGARPLPLEEPEPEPTSPVAVQPIADGALLASIERPGVLVRCVVARWDTCAFELRGASDRTSYLTVPRRRLEPFLSACTAGRLDRVLAEAVGVDG